MVSKSSKDLSLEAWMAFHNIRVTLLPPLIRHLSEKCGLSEAEYQIFMGLMVAEEKKMKPSQLSDHLGWDIGRVSHQVSRMESRGLLERHQCPIDARSCWIGMTKKGQILIEKAFPLQMQEVDRLFAAALTEKQFQSLIEISHAIEANIKNQKLKRT
jgi:DNA-binding MarR family transcriptional regulator